MMSRISGAVFAAMVAVFSSQSNGAVTGGRRRTRGGLSNKPLRVIVPFAAGGGNDIFAAPRRNKLSKVSPGHTPRMNALADDRTVGMRPRIELTVA